MYNKWKLIQVWILSSWSFLTVGILLGSWWAYHELGWGGWWFWDPVENASLMPWLIATSGLHSITKKKLNYWTLFYVQITFFLSILGTFFVRSGFLGSVHSFATDSTRGFFLLIFLLFLILFSLFNWIHPTFNQIFRSFFKTKRVQNNFLKKKVSIYHIPLNLNLSGQKLNYPRKWQDSKKIVEIFLFLQGFFFCLMCLVVFCGTIAPLFFFVLWGRDVGTGVPFYNGTLIPLFSSLFILLTYVHFYPYLKINSTKHYSFIKTKYSLFDISWGNSFQFFQKEFLIGIKKKFLKNLNSFYLIIFFYFVLHTVLFYVIISLNFLSSIYGSLCFLIVSTLFYTKKELFSFPAWPLLKSVLGLPCRYVNMTSNFVINQQITYLKKKIEPVKDTLSFNKQSHSTLGEETVTKKQELFIAFQKESIKHTNSHLEMKIAHLGLIFLLVGILFSNGFKFQLTQNLQAGSVIQMGKQICCLRSIDHSFAPTFQSICANLLVYPSASSYNLPIFGLDFRENFWSQKILSCCSLSMFPEKRFYYSSINTSTTKVAIHSNFITDLYSSIGTGSLETGWFTTVMKLPAIFSIWLGFSFGVVGGLLSLRKQLKKAKTQWF